EDASGTLAAPPARPAGAAAATAARGLDRGRAPGGLVSSPRPCDCGARGVCSRPGAVAGEPTPRPAVAAWRAVSAPGRGPVPAVWVCLLRQTSQPKCPQRPAPRLRVLPLPGDGCVPLWLRAGLSEYASAHRPARSGRLAGSLYVVGPPGAAGGGISAPLAAGDGDQ